MSPGDQRAAPINGRLALTHGLADPRWAHRTLDTAWEKLHALAAWGYPLPNDETGKPYLANLRGPDYLHVMRRRVRRAGVKILDQPSAWARHRDRSS